MCVFCVTWNQRSNLWKLMISHQFFLVVSKMFCWCSIPRIPFSSWENHTKQFIDFYSIWCYVLRYCYIPRPSNQRSLNFFQDQSCVDVVFGDQSSSEDSVTDVDVYVASGLEVALEERPVEVMETDEVRWVGRVCFPERSREKVEKNIWDSQWKIVPSGYFT